jgi:hypothetical protein
MQQEMVARHLHHSFQSAAQAIRPPLLRLLQITHFTVTAGKEWRWASSGRRLGSSIQEHFCARRSGESPTTVPWVRKAARRKNGFASSSNRFRYCLFFEIDGIVHPSFCRNQMSGNPV